MTSAMEVNRVSVVNGSATKENNSNDKLDSTSDDLQILSSLEASIEILRPAKDTDPRETEAISEKLSSNQSPAPKSIPADQNGDAMLSLTRQEEQSNLPPEWSTEQLTFNSTAYDSGSEMGDHKRSKSIAGGSECASESINRQSCVHHSFSRSSDDFIQDLYSSLVRRSASASASVTRQSSVHEFSRSSEDFLQDLFKSLVTEAGGGSGPNRGSRQGSMLETAGSTEDMIQDLFKSLQDNPRE